MCVHFNINLHTLFIMICATLIYQSPKKIPPCILNDFTLQWDDIPFHFGVEIYLTGPQLTDV